MKLLYADINRFDIELLKEKASKERLEKALKFKYEKDIKLSLLAGILLEDEIDELGILVSKPIHYHIDSYSKPHLFDSNSNEIFFSLSHAGNYAVCIWDTKPCGADIEEIKECKLNIAERFFHDNEKAMVIDEYTFYKYWTLKEAFMKITGLGMSLPMNDFYAKYSGKCNGDELFEYFYSTNLLKTGNSDKPVGRTLNLVEGYAVSVCGFDVENLSVSFKNRL